MALLRRLNSIKNHLGFARISFFYNSLIIIGVIHQIVVGYFDLYSILFKTIKTVT